MRTTRSLLVLASLAIVCAACSREPKTTEEVLKDIGAKSAKIQTYAADYDIAMNMGGMAMNLGGDIKGKDKLMAMTMNINMMGQQIAMKMITDNTGMTWMDMDMMGQKQVMKMDMTQAQQMQQQMMPGMPSGMGGPQNDPRKAAEQHSQMFDLSYTGKEKHGDEDVYVLAGKLKDTAKSSLAAGPAGNAAAGIDVSSMMSSARLKIGVKDGFPRSAEILGNDDKPWMTQTYKNVKLNASLDDAQFSYTPPAGVQVMDMSEMAGAAMQEQSAVSSPGETPQH